MTHRLDLRPARPADLPALRALHSANWRHAYAHLVPDSALGAPLAAYMQAKWSSLDVAGQSVVVAMAEARLAGFACLLDRGTHTFLDNLHVDRRHRGRGIGRALMAAAAEATGDRPLRLEVLEGNTAALDLYRRWGGHAHSPRAVRFLGCDIAEREVGWPSGSALVRHLLERAA